jgi:hypothetical protein
LNAHFDFAVGTNLDHAAHVFERDELFVKEIGAEPQAPDFRKRIEQTPRRLVGLAEKTTGTDDWVDPVFAASSQAGSQRERVTEWLAAAEEHDL